MKCIEALKSKKLNVFGFFFLLAFLFLVLTKLSKEYTETLIFNVTYSNIPKDNIVVSNEPQQIKITIKSLGFYLFSQYFNDNSIDINFKEDVALSGNNFVWLVSKNEHKISSQLGNSSTIISVKPDSILIPFQKLESKKVPVVLDKNIEFSFGYNASTDFEITPDSVKIIGSKNDIDNVLNIKTKPLQLKEIKSDINTKIDLWLIDSISNLKLSQYNVSVFAKVEKFTEGVLEVPVSIVNLPSNMTINYFPKTVSIVYYVSLNNYKHIKPLDFKVECDYSEILNSDKKSLVPRLVKIPDEIKTARIKQTKIEFILMQ